MKIENYYELPIYKVIIINYTVFFLASETNPHCLILVKEMSAYLFRSHVIASIVQDIKNYCIYPILFIHVFFS